MRRPTDSSAAGWLPIAIVLLAAGMLYDRANAARSSTA
jgi:hypothetical protein